MRLAAVAASPSNCRVPPISDRPGHEIGDDFHRRRPSEVAASAVSSSAHRTFLTSDGLITRLTNSVYVPLQPDTAYTFAVQAWDQNGNSSPLSAATTFRTPPRDTALTCSASFSAIVWSTGFYVTGQVKNTSSYIINGWVIRFAIPGDQQITNGFNGTFTQVGHDVTVVSGAFNGRIDAYGQVSFGYYGYSTIPFTKPTAYTLNGVGCTGT